MLLILMMHALLPCPERVAPSPFPPCVLLLGFCLRRPWKIEVVICNCGRICLDFRISPNKMYECGFKRSMTIMTLMPGELGQTGGRSRSKQDLTNFTNPENHNNQDLQCYKDTFSIIEYRSIRIEFLQIMV